MATRNFLAMDFGASNGRGILGSFDGKTLSMREVHRFANEYVPLGGVLYWDILRLYGEVVASLRLCAKEELFSVGIDTWGVDFGLLDKNGRLLGNPLCYRQATEEMAERTHSLIARRTLFERTGTANQIFNTVYQLHARKEIADPALEAADTLLLLPDLLGYFLSGEKGTEYTNVTTSGLYSPHSRDWDWEIIDRLGVPRRIFTPIHRASTVRGTVFADLDGGKGVKLVSVATHDTGSAVAAVPGRGDFAFLSSGTWSLIGVENDAPVINDAVYAAQYSNEGTLQGGYRPLKNIMGLWIIQECRRQWTARGSVDSWDNIVAQARVSSPLRSLIDPDSAEFFSAGNMEEKIRAFCARTKQPIPQTVGEVTRCVYESLALKYRWALERLEEIVGKRQETLHIVGGGAQNKLLNQFVANALGRPVLAGPVEGACIGNLLSQAMAAGEISSICELREVVRASFPIEEYVPQDSQVWQDGYGRLLNLMKN